MAIYEFEGKRPIIEESSFVHPEATIIGEVIIGKNCYIGPGARIRGDWGRIEIGDGSNVQENCVIHSRPEKTATLGANSHIGHGAILHGPILKEHVVVGMGAIIHDQVVIGENCVVGAGAVILEGEIIPPNKIVAGVPGKVISEVKAKQRDFYLWGTRLYQTLPKRCQQTMKKIG